MYELPRPREGPRAVDAFMIPLLDEEVAYEVLRYVTLVIIVRIIIMLIITVEMIER